ncbi:MAG: TrkH family potassium uptake protein, partial [Myxococcales bacterium]|nr:TrkH family potassium uptake protein [Myxococcales bacterium]
MPTTRRTTLRRDYRSVARPVGGVVIGLGLTIGLCALLARAFDALLRKPDPIGGGYVALGVGALVSLVLGTVAYVYGSRHAKAEISRYEATLAVGLIWAAAGVCGAVPFVVGAGMDPAAALFESVSGLTTTGATAISDIEGTLSRPLLLWRSLIQWLGGMGIVVLFVAIFPNVGVGGKHMFRGEVPGTSAEGLKPRIAETAVTLWKLYVAFTLLEIAVLTSLGMNAFEATCHALTTMSTGGFSTRNDSIGAFQSPAIEVAIACFMYVGTVNYGLYFVALKRRTLRGFRQSVEFKTFAAIVLVSVLVVTVGILGHHGGNWPTALRRAFFMVATTISSTGYGTDDYMAYPSPALLLIVVLMFIGGCSGSTAGGLKIERVVLMAKQAWLRVGAFFRPKAIQVVRMGGAVVDKSTLADVAAFFILYMVTIVVGIGLVTVVENVSLPTAFGV